MRKLNRDCTTRVKAAGRHSLPEELLELLLAEPESRPRLQATNTVLKPLFIIRSYRQLMGKFLVISNSLIYLTFDPPILSTVDDMAQTKQAFFFPEVTKEAITYIEFEDPFSGVKLYELVGVYERPLTLRSVPHACRPYKGCLFVS